MKFNEYQEILELAKRKHKIFTEFDRPATYIPLMEPHMGDDLEYWVACTTKEKYDRR